MTRTEIEMMAARLLLDQRLKSFDDFKTLNVIKLKFKRKNIKFYSIGEYCRTVGIPRHILFPSEIDGCRIGCVDGVDIILYNEFVRCRARANWTLAHEVGHAYLNHESETDKEEIEANSFAAALLMPEVILKQIEAELCGLRPLDDGDILGRFNVSYEAAMYRIENIERRSKRKYSNAEQMILELYFDDIREKRERAEFNEIYSRMMRNA